MWALTPAANKFFPDGNAELLVDMIGLIDNVLGQDALAKVITGRADSQFHVYQARMASSKTLQDRLNLLADIRTEEGYMAEVQPQADGSYLFIENHCPICAASISVSVPPSFLSRYAIGNCEFAGMFHPRGSTNSVGTSSASNNVTAIGPACETKGPFVSVNR